VTLPNSARGVEIARCVKNTRAASTVARYSVFCAARSGAQNDKATGMMADWAIWAAGMVFVLVNAFAWTLIRINDIPPSRR
jgi:hypothetical protein